MEERACHLISIVDDDDSVREATVRLLKANGFRANSYSSAMEFLESEQIDETACLILDMRMPGMSGLELQRRLGEESRSIPAVFISAHASPKLRAEVIEAGAIDFLPKPFTEEALLNALDTIYTRVTTNQNRSPMLTNSAILPFHASEVEIGIPFNPEGGMTSWSDAQLIFSVQSDPPDEEALEILVGRYWESAFVRCQMLTLNRERAFDLAQETWCRLLRNRHALKPDGNFPAYLATIATNLFRDSYRAARRAGPLGEHQLVSLESPVEHEEGEAVFLVNILPDLKSLRAEKLTQLKLDMDAALGRLGPQLREVLVARYIDGESCAEIGIRHGRTEQTISGWVRAALRQMKAYLEEPEPGRSPRPLNVSDEANWQEASVPA